MRKVKSEVKNKVAKTKMVKNIKVKKILKRVALGGILWSVASAIYGANASI
jgi:hypothetical protein